MLKEGFSKDFTIAAALEEVDRVAQEIARVITEACDRDKAFRAAVCLTEACSNIIKHGYKSDSSKKLTIRVKASLDSVELTIEDSSEYFDPLDADSPDLSNAHNLQDGGMGILIIKKTARTISYERREGKNTLKLTF